MQQIQAASVPCRDGEKPPRPCCCSLYGNESLPDATPAPGAQSHRPGIWENPSKQMAQLTKAISPITSGSGLRRETIPQERASPQTDLNGELPCLKQTTPFLPHWADLTGH